MRSFQLIVALVAVSGSTSAFPSIALEAAQLAGRDASISQQEAHEKRVNGILPGFNAGAQRIDVSGKHAFVPPNFKKGDLRGPCPGLNALANHNYLPHNGFATIDQFVSATNEVFGMVRADPNALLKPTNILSRGLILEPFSLAMVLLWMEILFLSPQDGQSADLLNSRLSKASSGTCSGF